MLTDMHLLPESLIDAPEPPEWFVHKAKRTCGRPGDPYEGMPRGRFTVMHPAMASPLYDSRCDFSALRVRGAGVEGRLLVYQTERFTAYLDVRWDERGAATVTGQIIGDRETLPSQVGLWDDELHIPLASTEMTDMGFFVLPQVEPRPSMMLTLGDDPDGEVRWLAFPLFADERTHKS